MTRRKKPAPPPAAAEAQAIDESGMSSLDRVLLHADEIAACWATGMSYAEIGAGMQPPLPGYHIAAVVHSEELLSERMRLARELRAEMLMDAAVNNANKTATAGYFDKAAALQIKLAEKYAPGAFGERKTLEHTGPGGGPIKSEVSMTPDEAYRAMLSKGA